MYLWTQSSPPSSPKEELDSDFVLLSHQPDISNLSDDAKHVPKPITVNVNDTVEMGRFIKEHGNERWLSREDRSVREVDLMIVTMIQFVIIVVMGTIALLLLASPETPGDPTTTQAGAINLHLEISLGQTACTSSYSIADSLMLRLNTSCIEVRRQ
ncbi:uncharacterized protein BDZ99DRAFT_469507 [Mytilinidion resinicola]|uniref:Uncharacterized protein n=1 Tax=Mytilinidion resinicola TaxID=574789 RepID=A0A6A6XYX3_9PEZI|nr:uncharacterized protein BDZ99DRAFT_469507 [Mytilinidion resinicola]KAF2801766.1 hypothetical protein BDZ99DRAFT_469507 [Mytilinidion resinicola]